MPRTLTTKNIVVKLASEKGATVTVKATSCDVIIIDGRDTVPLVRSSLLRICKSTICDLVVERYSIGNILGNCELI